MILVSACLAGVNCVWDGSNKLRPEIKAMVDRGEAVAICPEALGGRTIPRKRAEIKSGSGNDAIDGKAKVFDEDGKDVTAEFIKGARVTLSIVKIFKIKKAILKSKSPSCGVGKIYNGTFKGNLIEGDGLTTALLKREGISCQGI